MKTCIITGGNSGIGKQAAIQIAKEGHKVIIAVRNEKRGEKAVNEIITHSENQNVSFELVDLSSQKSIKNFADRLNRNIEKIDILIHNAADFDISRKKAIYSEENIETIWASNHIGVVLMTSLLEKLLKNSEQARIITIASKGLVMHPNLKINFKNTEFKNSRYTVSKAYYQSKLAQIMYTYWLAEKYKKENITVNCIRVTNVKIDIEKYPNLPKFMKKIYGFKSKFSISPEEMAKTYTHLALTENLKEITGKYFDENLKTVKSSKYSMDKNEIEKLMELTFNYIK